MEDYILLKKSDLEKRVKTLKNMFPHGDYIMEITILEELLNSPTVNIEEIWLAAREIKGNMMGDWQPQKYPTLNDFLKDKV
jgi:hypothetical protein